MKRSKNYYLPTAVKRNSANLFMGRGAAVQTRQVYHVYHLLLNTRETDFRAAQCRFSKTSLLVHTAANWKGIFVCVFATICLYSVMCEAGCTNFSA